MMKDIRIINDTSGEVNFLVYDAHDDGGLMLLQRLYVLMFSESVTVNREANGYTLLDLLVGGNQPPDAVLTSIVSICCSDAVALLDEEDRQQIVSFNGRCTNGVVTCTLTLADGTTVEGKLDHD